MLDAHEIADRLWQGALPSDPQDLEGFDMLVSVGPRADALPDGVLQFHYALVDPMWEDEFGLAQQLLAMTAAAKVVQSHSAGRRVLVTCKQGLNRSGYVMALALHHIEQISRQEAASRVQQRRDGALYNPVLTDVLARLDAADAGRLQA